MDKKWYVVNTYSGHENKVKEKLEMRTVSMGMEDYIFRVIVPEEKIIEEKNGVKKERVRTSYSLGYQIDIFSFSKTLFGFSLIILLNISSSFNVFFIAFIDFSYIS